MSIARSFAISASGLTAERTRMNTIANNIANVNTPGFRRGHVIFRAVNAGPTFGSLLGAAMGEQGGGVRATVGQDNGPFKRVYNPNHPDADRQGYVSLPNIEPVMEMVDLITASRAFEAGVNAIGAARQMQQKALEIGKG